MTDPDEVVKAGALSLRTSGASAGKIVSVTSSSGREWLLPVPRESLAPDRATPSVYVAAADFGGWDECFPNIEPDPDLALPDHGQAWNAPYRRTRLAQTEAGEWLMPTGALRRRLSPSGPGHIRFDYSASFPRTGKERPLLWAGHPQFTATAIDRMRMNCSVPECLPNGAGQDLPLCSEITWGHGIKVAVPICSHQITLQLIYDDEALALSWSGAEIPYLNIWYDNGRYASEPVISPQPTIAASPGENRSWHMELAVTEFR